MTIENYLCQIEKLATLKEENFDHEISQLITLGNSLNIDLRGIASIRTKEIIGKKYKLPITDIKDKYFLEMSIIDLGRKKHLYFAKIDKREFYSILDTLKEEIEYEGIKYSKEIFLYEK
ncbi:hypothetical protein [Fusobacterium sp. PH5-44]|uniref:hypothetical protein n=1 Tax=unclassified Fusobacterium TaxID=2648384 RepID=UPI003D21FE06